MAKKMGKHKINQGGIDRGVQTSVREVAESVPDSAYFIPTQNQVYALLGVEAAPGQGCTQQMPVNQMGQVGQQIPVNQMGQMPASQGQSGGVPLTKQGGIPTPPAFLKNRGHIGIENLPTDTVTPSNLQLQRFNQSELTPEQRASYAQMRRYLQQAGDPSEIRSYGADIMDSLERGCGSMFEECRIKDAGESGALLNDLTVASKEITAIVKPQKMFGKFIRSAKLKSGEYDTVASKLAELTDNVSETIQNLRVTTDNMVTTCTQVMETINNLAPITGALRDDILDNQEYLSSLADDSPDKIVVQHIIETKIHRLRTLEAQSTVSSQQAWGCWLIAKANHQWTEELSEGISVALPVFRTSVLQSIALQQGKQAANIASSLREATNAAIVQVSDQLKENIGVLADMHERSFLDMGSIEQAQRNLNDIVGRLSNSQSKMLQMNLQDLAKLEEMKVQPTTVAMLSEIRDASNR